MCGGVGTSRLGSEASASCRTNGACSPPTVVPRVFGAKGRRRTIIES